MKTLLIFLLTVTLLFSNKIEVNCHVKLSPFVNINDNYKDGICIDAMNSAINKLVDYKHKVSVIPFSRTMEEIKVLNLVYSSYLLKNKDRAKNMYFSKFFWNKMLENEDIF